MIKLKLIGCLITILKDEGVKEAMWIRRADLENHNKDGGTWIVIGGKVYDIQDFRPPNRSQHASGNNVGGSATGSGGVVAGAASDAFEELTSGIEQASSASQGAAASSIPQDPELAQETLKSFFVGNLLEPDGGSAAVAVEARCPFPDLPNFSSPFMDLERNLAALLGLHSNSLFHSTPLQPEELNCSRWTRSVVLRGGLRSIVERDPFDETKGEGEVPLVQSSHSPSSQPPTPMIASAASDAAGLEAAPEDSNGRTDGAALVRNLAEGNLSDPGLKTFMAVSQRLSREHHLTFQMNFPPEHPVEEAGRILFALLLKFQGLEAYLGQVIDAEMERLQQQCDGGDSMSASFGGRTTVATPRPLIETLKTVHHTKWKLIKMRQEQGRSYKEVCTQVSGTPIILQYFISEFTLAET